MFSGLRKKDILKKRNRDSGRLGCVAGDWRGRPVKKALLESKKATMTKLSSERKNTFDLSYEKSKRHSPRAPAFFYARKASYRSKIPRPKKKSRATAVALRVTPTASIGPGHKIQQKSEKRRGHTSSVREKTHRSLQKRKKTKKWRVRSLRSEVAGRVAKPNCHWKVTVPRTGKIAKDQLISVI